MEQKVKFNASPVVSWRESFSPNTICGSETSSKCKTSWFFFFNNPWWYVFTLAIIVFSFLHILFNNIAVPDNRFHVFSALAKCLTEKQLTLLGSCIGRRSLAPLLVHGSEPQRSCKESGVLSNHTATWTESQVVTKKWWSRTENRSSSPWKDEEIEFTSVTKKKKKMQWLV